MTGHIELIKPGAFGDMGIHTLPDIYDHSIERFASLSEWTEMLDDNGFIVEKVYKYNKFNRNKLLVFLRSLMIPVQLSHHFVFICRKDNR